MTFRDEPPYRVGRALQALRTAAIAGMLMSACDGDVLDVGHDDPPLDAGDLAESTSVARYLSKRRSGKARSKSAILLPGDPFDIDERNTPRIERRSRSPVCGMRKPARHRHC
jgi:hypothetical protein